MKEPVCIKSWNVCASTCRHDFWSLSFNPVPIIKLYFRFLPSHNQSSHKPNLVKCNSPTNVGKNFIERLMADQLRLILILRYWEWYLGVAYFSQARGWNDDHVEICESPRRNEKILRTYHLILPKFHSIPPKNFSFPPWRFFIFHGAIWQVAPRNLLLMREKHGDLQVFIGWSLVEQRKSATPYTPYATILVSLQIYNESLGGFRHII